MKILFVICVLLRQNIIYIYTAKRNQDLVCFLILFNILKNKLIIEEAINLKTFLKTGSMIYGVICFNNCNMILC